MSKRPKMLDTISDMSAKQEAFMATKKAVEVEPKRDVDKEIPEAAQAPKPAGGKPLPKVTLYAHPDVLKAIRLLAVEDGKQAQEILRAAVRDYLAKRGHAFTDLTTGR